MATQHQPLSAAARNYVIGIVSVGFLLNFIDRQILALLLQPIKEEFAVSDTTLGLLSGLSFALLYSTLCMPIARLADRTSRSKILAISMAVWSAATAACGMAQSVWQLVFFRLGVGIGEAGFSPAALSLVADCTPKHRRATAIAIAQLGIPLGIVGGLLIGGWGVEHYGWRGAFVIAGLPGIAIAVLFRLTVRDPSRTSEASMRNATTALPPVGEALVQLWRNRTYRYILIGNCCSATVVYGLSTWIPTLLVRSFGLRPLEVGYLLAGILGGAGILGYMAGGLLSDKVAVKSPARVLWLCAIASISAIPLVALAAFASSPVMLAISYGTAYCLGLIYAAPTVSAICNAVPAATRTFSIGVMHFGVNLVGLGLGPLMVGMMTDAFGGAPHDLGRALVLLSLIYIPAAAAFALAARSAHADIGDAAKPGTELGIAVA